MKRVLVFLTLFAAFIAIPARAQGIDTSPPEQPVKLIFIHHSVGENWLTDGYGNLGIELAANNYFVSDTGYGWGPDGIGDRTDIVNWPEWFTGPDSERYMQAVYNETNQRSNYARHFGDPGGENTIVMFKSCFPNSELSGNPNDPPDPGMDYSVGHAKYVYNELLTYFGTRPDKLFIVITAPPVQNPTYADNARAFNNWLVYDWLEENNYTLNNVAVFDFHNVLTHPDNHHRIAGGGIEHVNNGANTLYYDSDGDNHPNAEGSQKATAEFIPLLNFYYNRWIDGTAGTAPLPESSGESEAEPPTEPEVSDAPGSDSPPAMNPVNPTAPGVIDNFDNGAPANTFGWEAFIDESNADTTLSCGIDSSVAQAGSGSLRIDFYIEPESWATCALFYDTILNWSNAEGITFQYRADAPGRIFHVTVHGGTLDYSTSYQYSIETVPESVDGWVPMELTWNQILGVDWEEDANNPINPAEITGISFGFDTYEGTPNGGTIWIDSLSRWPAAGGTAPPPSQSEAEPSAEISSESPSENTSEQPQTEVETPSEGGGLPCKGASALGAAAFFGAVWQSRRRKINKAD